MNPFLHPTVAQPLGVSEFVPNLNRTPPDDERLSAEDAADAVPALPDPMPKRRHPAALSDAARTLLLVTSLGWATLPTQAAPVNANIATATQLETIKGIGPKTAQIIIQERERSGPYESMQDLSERVRGIGPRKARALREAGLTVSSHSAAPASSLPR